MHTLAIIRFFPTFGRLLQPDRPTTVEYMPNQRNHCLSCQCVSALETTNLTECKGLCGISLCTSDDEHRFFDMLAEHNVKFASVNNAYEENENKDCMCGSKDQHDHLTSREILQEIQKNAGLPSVIRRGKKPSHWRFWNGQGVNCSESERCVRSSAIKTCFDPSIEQLHDFESLPYEIETDEGVCIPVPKDGTSHTAQAPDSNIISDDIFVEMEHIETFKAERESNFQYSIGAHNRYGQSLRKCGPKIHKRCSTFCGTKSAQKIPICIAYESSVHCDKTLQVKNCPGHKGTCNIGLEVKLVFLTFTSEMLQMDRRRQKMFRAWTVLANCHDMVNTVLMKTCRLLKDMENLGQAVTIAINITLIYIESEEICGLA